MRACALERELLCALNEWLLIHDAARAREDGYVVGGHQHDRRCAVQAATGCSGCPRLAGARELVCARAS